MTTIIVDPCPVYPMAGPVPTPFSQLHIDVVAGHRDARGVVFEPLTAADIARFRNVHVVVTEPGAVRGNHRHLRGSEITTVPGPMLVRVRDAGVVRDYVVPDGVIWRFAFPPGVAHAFKNVGPRAAVIASFNTEEHHPAQPDAERDVLIET